MPWVDVNAKDITEGQKEELPSRRRSCEEMLLSKLAAVPDIEAGRGGGGGPSGHCATCESSSATCRELGCSTYLIWQLLSVL
jgi:hypothetical protein